jgi:hypothetical protein
MPKAVDSVIFDFGGPVMRTPFEMVRDFERRRGLPERTLDWRGPFDPDADSAWRKVLTGELKERDYWRLRAEEFARFTGGSDIRSMFDALYDVSAEVAVRPEAEQMLADIKAAGLRSAILTNDMGMFHSPRLLASIRFIAEVRCRRRRIDNQCPQARSASLPRCSGIPWELAAVCRVHRRYAAQRSRRQGGGNVCDLVRRA